MSRAGDMGAEQLLHTLVRTIRTTGGLPGRSVCEEGQGSGEYVKYETNIGSQSPNSQRNVLEREEYT